MSVAGHRIAASAILLCASLGLVAVGRTMVQDSPAVAAVRDRLAGKWVATRIEIAPRTTVQGDTAAQTTVEFAGREVRFRNLVDAPTAEGVYNLAPDPKLGKVDFKLDAGWILGSYALDGDRLTLCVNALGLPEQLGVPARGRPGGLDPSEGRFVYEFTRVKP